MRTNGIEHGRSEKRDTSPAREVRGPGGNLTWVSSGVCGIQRCAPARTPSGKCEAEAAADSPLFNGVPVVSYPACRHTTGGLPHRAGGIQYRNKNAKTWRADQSVQIWNGCNVSPNRKQSQLGFSRDSLVFALGNRARETFIDAMCLSARTCAIGLFYPRDVDPALRSTRRTFLGEIDRRAATRAILRPSLSQTLGITISANSSLTC